MAEFALLPLLAKRHLPTNCRLQETAQAILGLLPGTGGRGLFGAAARAVPDSLIGQLIRWLALDAWHSKVMPPRRHIQHLVDTGELLSLSRFPHRALELRYFLGIGGFNSRLPSFARLLEQAETEFLPKSSDVDALYRFTHLVFYATDYGASPQSFLTDQQRGRFTAHLGRTIKALALHGHVDLVIETMLARWCLDPAAVRTSIPVWLYLASVQNASGCFCVDHNPNRGCRFLLAYHPVLLSALSALLMPDDEI